MNAMMAGRRATATLEMLASTTEKFFEVAKQNFSTDSNESLATTSPKRHSMLVAAGGAATKRRGSLADVLNDWADGRKAAGSKERLDVPQTHPSWFSKFGPFRLL